MAANAETPVPTWQRGRVASWLVTVDHKRIGILYLVTSGVFFLAGGLMAAADAHAARRRRTTTSSTRDGYNELFTMHGTTMVFLVVVPILAGFGNFLVPLMIGARDMAFPRLNALSYWLFLFGGIILLLSFFADGGAAKAGWTATRRSRLQAQGNGQDLWILGLHILTLSSLAGAINFIVTIHNMRTRGMSWTRMPLFVWAIEIYAVPAARRAADALGRPDAAAARPAGGHELLRRRARAAAPCSTSTPSGSSATPRSTS